MRSPFKNTEKQISKMGTPAAAHTHGARWREQQCDHEHVSAKSGPAGIISDGTPSAHVLMWPGRACCGAQAGGRA